MASSSWSIIPWPVAEEKTKNRKVSVIKSEMNKLILSSIFQKIHKHRTFLKKLYLNMLIAYPVLFENASLARDWHTELNDKLSIPEKINFTDTKAFIDSFFHRPSRWTSWHSCDWSCCEVHLFEDRLRGRSEIGQSPWNLAAGRA